MINTEISLSGSPYSSHPIVKKKVEYCLRWFGNIWRRPVKDRGRPKKHVVLTSYKDMKLNGLLFVWSLNIMISFAPCSLAHLMGKCFSCCFYWAHGHCLILWRNLDCLKDKDLFFAWTFKEEFLQKCSLAFLH